jgi:cation transport ATPase
MTFRRKGLIWNLQQVRALDQYSRHRYFTAWGQGSGSNGGGWYCRVHLAMRFSSDNLRHWANVPLYATLLAGGLPLLVQLGRKLWAWEFGSDFLAGVSIVTAVLLRQYLVAAIVVLMLSGGTALEEYASRRASRVLDELAKRMPGIAHRKAEQGLVDIPAQDIVVGDTLVVLPHEICPVDGVVFEGQGAMNEAYLTSEPFEVEKVPGATVLSGALNGESLLIIRAEKLPIDSARFCHRCVGIGFASYLVPILRTEVDFGINLMTPRHNEFAITADCSEINRG